MRATRWISLLVGFLPLIFVLFVPQILALSFFTRALRLSVSVVALIGIYLPFFDSRRGAVIGLAVAAVATTIWYLLDNPFGVDNMYVALLTPAIVLVMDKLLFPRQAQSEPSPAVATNAQAPSAAQRKAAH